MRTTEIFYTTLLASGVANALPSQEQPRNADIASLIDTHRVVEVDGGKKATGKDALEAAFRKYGWKLPKIEDRSIDAEENVAATTTTPAATTQTGTVQATDLPFDRAYYVNVTVGQQQMLLNMDSGSSDLWGFSTLLPKAEQGTHALYKLEGHLDSSETWDISYAEGTGAKGVVYADKVVIGKVTATEQAVEAATSVSPGFVTGLQDGIVGLGFEVGNTCSPYYCYTFMQNIYSSLPLPVFTATLRHNAPGTYDFGFIDTSKYTGALTYNSLTGNLGGGYWEFSVGGYSVGTGAQKARSMTFIADTGTSLLITDAVIVNAFYAGVTGAAYNSTYGGVVFPCSSASKLKNLSFYINNVKHTMPGAYGVYAQISSTTCYGGVQSNNGQGYTIMGDVFLKSQFVVFEIKTPRIGFAQQKGVAI